VADDPFTLTAELHDKKHQPDIENGRQMGMPLDDFIQETWEGLVAGKEDIPVGMVRRRWTVCFAASLFPGVPKWLFRRADRYYFSGLRSYRV
jgi:hypothetical protein